MGRSVPLEDWFERLGGLTPIEGNLNRCPIPMTRDHFRALAAQLPEGLEKELCLELASEEDEHIAMLETESEQAG